MDGDSGTLHLLSYLLAASPHLEPVLEERPRGRRAGSSAPARRASCVVRHLPRLTAPVTDASRLRSSASLLPTKAPKISRQ
eukprot:7332209-Pyramimonas_sp.AAC.1